MVKQKDMNILIAIFVIGAIILVAGFSSNWFGMGSVTQGNTGGNDKIIVGDCPADLGVVGTINVINALNSSATQTRDQNMRLYDSDGNFIKEITDTTSGDLAGVVLCGNEYVGRLVSASGETAIITGVSGKGVSVMDNGRAIKFTASAQTAINVESKAISGIQVKVYDNNGAGWLYDGSDASALDFETTGVTFKSTTDNATAMAIGTGGNFDVTMSLKSVTQYTDVSDLGLYVLVDADTASYDEETFSLTYNGVKLSKATLDQKEQTAYKDFDAVYLIPQSNREVISNNVESKLQIQLSALADVDPSADIGIDFAPIGSVKSVSGQNMRYSSVTDASSPSAIYTVQTTTFDIS